MKEASPDEPTSFQGSSYAPDLPDPDILIRTGSRRYIGNFLFWQKSYTKFVFTDPLWPDFSAAFFEDERLPNPLPLGRTD